MGAPATIHAWDIAADGTGQAVTSPETEMAEAAVFRWVHFDLAEPGVEDWIAEKTDRVVASALARVDTRPRAAVHGEGLILILRGVNLNPGSDPEDMVSLRLWVSKTLVISTRIRRLMAVAACHESLVAGRGAGSPGLLVAALTAGLTVRMEPVVAELVDELARLEEESVDRPSGLRGDIAEMRRTTLSLRRYIAPQREALARLYQDNLDLIDEKARASLRETSDQITRLVEELDAVRDRSAVLNDHLADARAEEMNQAMLLLSVVAAIFLPLGFLTGLLGINVGGLPGANWPLAFAVVCVLCAAIAGGLALLFKRMRWL